MFSLQVDENLKLALPDFSRAEEMTALVLANLDRLKPWMPWATDEYSIEDCKGFIEGSLKAFSESGRFEACIVEGDRIIGTIGFHNFDIANRSAHIGYWISKESEGKGIITKCCRFLVDYLFSVMKLNRVQINCNVENARSRAVPEHLGFQLEGIHRQVEFLNDRFGDWAVYAMLNEDWKPSESTGN